MNKILEIQNLSIRYSKSHLLLKTDQLTVNEGEIVVVFGDNGSGKSSLLGAISNATNNWEGNIQIDGTSIREWNKQLFVKKLAFISTENDFPSLLSTKEYVAFGRFPYLNWFGRLSAIDKELVDKYLEECCILELENQTIGSLSDGEKQRAKIARVLCQQTPILILDEPTSHLDIKNTSAILELIKLEKQKERKTIVFSSHEIQKSLSLADKVWYIMDGFIYSEKVQDFKENNKVHQKLFGKDYKVL